MRFYQQSPNVKEDKPCFADLPRPLIQDIERVSGANIIGGRIAWGGYSPTCSMIFETQNQGQIFAKGTYPDHTAHGYKILHQEIEVYQNIPDLQILAPPYMGYVSYGGEDDWHLGLWQAIENATIKKSLGNQDIDLIFTALTQFYKSFEKNHMFGSSVLKPAAQMNFVGPIVTGQNSWIKFKDHSDRHNAFTQMFYDQDMAQTWLDKNLNELIEQSLKSADHDQNMISFDLRLDNIVFDVKVDRPFIIDWPDACIAPVGYDIINLCINIMVESGQDSWDLLKQFTDISGIKISKNDLVVILSQLSGYYALQAYRAVPAKLPRLRWIQKAMLWGALTWLNHIDVCTDLPEFKD